MGSVILTMHTSADGFVATEEGAMWPAFGWPPEAQEVLNDLYRDAAAIIYGRGIYELVVPFWSGVARDGVPEGSGLGEVDLEFARLFSPTPKYVVSHDLEPTGDGVQAIRSDVVRQVTEIAEAADGHVLVLAGGALAGELAASGALDEILALVGPVLLGRGRPLLDVRDPIPARLLDVQAFPPSCTVLRYALAEEFPSRELSRDDT